MVDDTGYNRGSPRPPIRLGRTDRLSGDRKMMRSGGVREAEGSELALHRWVGAEYMEGHGTFKMKEAM